MDPVKIAQKLAQFCQDIETLKKQLSNTDPGTIEYRAYENALNTLKSYRSTVICQGK